MRYTEIISEASKSKAEAAWAAKKSSHEALRTYRTRQTRAADAAAEARLLPPGPGRARRIRAASDASREASGRYNQDLAKANEKMRRAAARSS